MAALRARRPELFSLRLSCANAEALLPEIDLVNEVLERAILAQRAAPPAAPAVLETGGSLEERRAHPQSIVAQVYDTELRAARYPFHLPFDLWTTEVRAYLALVGSSRLALMEVAAGSIAAALRDPAIAAERLGLSSADAALLVEQNFGEWGTINFSELNRLDRLVASTGLTAEDLFSLLACRFIAGRDRGLSLSGLETCRLDEVTTELYSGQNPFPLKRLHRFIRLRRTLGWDGHVLDRTLVALGALRSPMFDAQPVDDALLLRLSHVARLAEKLHIPPDEVAGWFADEMDTHAYELRGGTGVVQETVHELLFISNAPGHLLAPAVPLADRTTYSVLLELRLIAPPHNEHPLVQQQVDANDVDWRLTIDALRRLAAYVGPGSSVLTGVAVGLAERTTIAVVFDGSDPDPSARLRIYVHGRRAAAANPGAPLPDEVNNQAAQFLVSSANSTFDGAIRYVAVFDRALSDAEIAELQSQPGLPRLQNRAGLQLFYTMGAFRMVSPAVIPDDSGHARDAAMTDLPPAALLSMLANTTRRMPTADELRLLPNLPPYYRVFLDRAALAAGGSFSLDPLSFGSNPRTIADAEAAIRAALGLTEEDLAAVLAMEIGTGADEVRLSLANLSALYKHVALARSAFRSPNTRCSWLILSHSARRSFFWRCWPSSIACVRARSHSPKCCRSSMRFVRRRTIQ